MNHSPIQLLPAGDLSHRKMSKVHLSAFIYRLFHEDISSMIGTKTVHNSNCNYIHSDDEGEIFIKKSVNKSDKLTSEICVHKASH